jgi:predicted  nucleic acid-binding Zn-ribbon protein
MFLSQLQVLAKLSEVDVQLEELREELGDLPYEVEEMENIVRDKQKQVDETQQLLDDILKFRADGRVRIQELKDREVKITEQQFQVRNNREFDAITKEIEDSQGQQRTIDRELANTHLKEENVRALLNSQMEELEEAKERLGDKEKELQELSSDQNEEATTLVKQRLELASRLSQDILTNYERIREYHKDPVVAIRKNSCAGCFSAIPAQKVVEMRNYRRIDTCEHCGRLLYPEDMAIPETL